MQNRTSFRSEETFTQAEFRDWLDSVSPSDINHYELIRGRIVMSPPAARGMDAQAARSTCSLALT